MECENAMNEEKCIQSDGFYHEISSLMQSGQYQHAAELALSYARSLAEQAEKLDMVDQKEVLLKRSDNIASVYRDLLFLSENQQFQELHLNQGLQKQEQERRALITAEMKNKTDKLLSVYERIRNHFKLKTLPLFQPWQKTLRCFIERGITDDITSEMLQSSLDALLGSLYQIDNSLFGLRLGSRYKYEQDYLEFCDLSSEILKLLRDEKDISDSYVLSYQEIYWCCGSEVTQLVNGIISKINPIPSRW